MAIRREQRTRERGIVHMWAIGAVLPLVMLAAVAVDTGYILVARSQLQGSIDAGATATLLALQRGLPQGAAEAAARSLMDQNLILGNILMSSSFEFGDYESQKDRFRVGRDKHAPAVRISASHTFPPLLAGAFVNFFPSVHGETIASAGCREIVLMLDTTASWGADFVDATDALRDVVDQVASTALVGDQVGLGVFAAEADAVFSGLRPMPAAASQLDVVLDRVLAPCADYALTTDTQFLPQGGCSGTDHGAAIDVAIDIFEKKKSKCGAEKLLILVSDGAPCDAQGPGGTAADAVAAADRAAAIGINIAPIMLLNHAGPPPDCPGDAATDAAFNDSLARGFGEVNTVANSTDLIPLLPTLIRNTPVDLVR